ncbi:MAG TPA: hypothetical protein VIH99_12250 [Bdellovibrionota bacterium]|jgi:hypothetical protein
MLEKYQKCLELITNEYTAGDYFREVYEAKKNYFESLGVIAEDDPDFENQMDVFMSWYLFDRPLEKHDLPPVYLYYRKNQPNFSPEEDALHKALTQAKHSIFELVKPKGNSLVLRDLSNGQKFEVQDMQFKAGFSKGDVFEARLIPEGKAFVFANGFCFHPKEAYKFIESQMKKIREDDSAQRTKLLLKLGQMKNKQHRFPHIDPEYIYTLTPKF